MGVLIGKRGQTLDSIQYLDYKPGMVLRESDLIEELGVSRTPVREALLSLSKDYLVDIYPQRGTYVSSIDFDVAQEIAYMRFILDREICSSLCRQKTVLDDQVGEQLLLMEFLVKKKDYKEYIKQDNQFHRNIFRASDHEIIWNIISNSRAQYKRFLALELQIPGVMENSLNEHRLILEYIKAGDMDSLVTLLEKHDDHANMHERAIFLKKRFPEYFPEEAQS